MFSDVLDLEEVDRDLYRSRLVYPTGTRSTAAGSRRRCCRQPAARWTRDGCRTRCAATSCGLGRIPADGLRVDRDRDGRSLSARRMVAVQGGEVLASVSCSFSVAQDGPDLDVTTPPPAAEPEGLPDYVLPRLFSFGSRLPEQPYPASTWPLRLWARTTTALPDDPLVHAAALTYLSDMSTGVSAQRRRAA